MTAPPRTYTILHTEASLGWGGQERRIVAEAQAMVRRGHRVLVAADPRSQLAVRAPQAGLPFFPLACGGRRNLGALWALRRLLARQQVEILNTHSSLDSWLGAMAVLGRRRQTKLVRTRHLSTPIQTSFPTRWLYQQADAIITTGAAIKTLISTRAQVPPARIVSIPTGVDLERFHPDVSADRAGNLPQTWAPDVPIIGVVAVLRSWKGHLYLLEALHHIQQAGVAAHLLCVGDGPYRVVLEPRIAALHLGDSVWLAGYQEEVPQWLALMDIVVLASYANEGVPQCLLQAMAMGKPVVGTQCGGSPEIVLPEVTGLLVPPQDSRALAQALLRLLQDPAGRRRLGTNGRELVARQYSVSQMAAAVEEVYAQLRA